MSTIETILSKGDVGAGNSRSRTQARQLLGDFKKQLHLLPGPDDELDHALESFLAEAVLGAAWYQKRCGGALRRVWFYIVVNGLLVVGLPISLMKIGMILSSTAALPAQITAVLMGILALQKMLGTWYASQQRYAAWYKARSDLKTIYYAFVQAWAGKVTSTEMFLPALETATAASRKVIEDERQDYFQKLALPSFDVLDMLTSTRSTVSTLVTGLLPGAPPASMSVVGKTTLLATAGDTGSGQVAAVLPPVASTADVDGRWTTINIPGSFAADVLVLLTDGSVLLHNAYSTDITAARQWMRLTPGKDGAYETGTWSPAADMRFGRQWFASGILPNGRLFVIGGEYCEDPLHATDCPTGEIFDPVANTWSPINKPSQFDFVCGDCNGTVLADGRVLLGAASTTDDPQTWVTRTAIWNPVNNLWTEAGRRNNTLAQTTKTDPFEEETFALLQDGSVLAVAVRDTPKAQRYVPSLDAWVDCAPSPVNLAITTIGDTHVFETGPAILLPDGRLFYVGGNGETALFTAGTNATDLGSWQIGPSFPPDNSPNPVIKTLTALDAPACLLPNGKVVLVGGSARIDNNDYFSADSVFLIYDPGSPAATLPKLNPQPVSPANNHTWQCLFLLLPTGQLLCSAQNNTLNLFTPTQASPNPAWMPANISFPATVTRGQTYPLSGTQINGLSQAVNYGDDAGMATNYPIVRLADPGGSTVVYALTSGFSSMGVATKQARQSCMVTIPAANTMAAGTWHMTVIANGIASAAVEVTVV